MAVFKAAGLLPVIVSALLSCLDRVLDGRDAVEQNRTGQTRQGARIGVIKNKKKKDQYKHPQGLSKGVRSGQPVYLTMQYFISAHDTHTITREWPALFCSGQANHIRLMQSLLL